MTEIDLIIRNSKYYVINHIHYLSWFDKRKKCCDCKSWKYFFTV